MAEYIDKKAALNIAEEECDGGTPYDIPMKLENLPAADVRENVKGEWVGVHAYCDYLNEEAKVNGKTQQYFPTGMVIGVYCNQCWCRADKKSDFCPNCGAYMGEKNE